MQCFVPTRVCVNTTASKPEIDSFIKFSDQMIVIHAASRSTIYMIFLTCRSSLVFLKSTRHNCRLSSALDKLVSSDTGHTHPPTHIISSAQIMITPTNPTHNIIPQCGFHMASIRRKSTRLTAVVGGLTMALAILFASFAKELHQVMIRWDNNQPSLGQQIVISVLVFSLGSAVAWSGRQVCSW